MTMEAEIINPSDKAFVSVEDWEAACIAVCIVGNGKYGLDREGSDGMPIFLFQGPDTWFKAEFGKSFEESLTTVGAERIRKALASFRYPKERTSMNNFVGHAHKLSKTLELKAKSTPPQ